MLISNILGVKDFQEFYTNLGQMQYTQAVKNLTVGVLKAGTCCLMGYAVVNIAAGIFSQMHTKEDKTAKINTVQRNFDGMPRPIFNLIHRDENGTVTHREVDTIVSDGDGTVYGTPAAVEPELDTSPAHQPIISWLKSGKDQINNKFTRLFVLITGGEFKRTEQRFTRHIPQELRPGVLISANGGSVLYYHDENGVAKEDTNYRKSAIAGGTVIAPEVADDIVEQAIPLLNNFFYKIRNDSSLRQSLQQTENGKFKFLIGIADERKTPYEKNELLTLNTKQVPRIEVRKTDDGEITQIAIMGIPSFIKDEGLDAVASAYPSLRKGRISLTIEINLHGVDKLLVLKYLGINPHRSVALGDNPHENDYPLTKYEIKIEDQKIKMPFVSVCKDSKKIPEELLPLHLGNNMEGSARLINTLLQVPFSVADPKSVIQTELANSIHSVRDSLK